MSPATAPPFPAEAVRDLLGLVRAMYAAAKAAGAPSAELRRVERIGASLHKALELAATTTPGSLGHAAAWRRAEEATEAVGDLVDALTPAAPIVTAARLRVSGARVALRTKPPER
ncbi:MAG TPA: hypothetical protein VHB21_26250 [Minicystis sp.]|nr:hypothetical protein [Minicystis sp.]